MDIFDQVILVRCEWDIGQDGFVFLSFEAARNWAAKALVDCGIDDDIEDLEAEGLVDYDWWKVYA